MKISVFGLGYVGCVTAACLAARGHEVVGVDVNPDKVNDLNAGQSPIVEPGLAELILQGRGSGHLRATRDAPEAVAHSQVLIVCVGTPSDAYGNLDFTFIDRICTDIAHSFRDPSPFKVIAVRSTLLPGTISQRLIPLMVNESGRQAGETFAIAGNPEFLREGSAIADFNNPPFTIIGTLDGQAGALLEQLYQDVPAPIFRTDPDTASMVKYACNAFHGLKVVFANEIGQLCKRAGVDGTQVMDIFCKDTRLNISPRYLKPGFAFGGSCLPKDLRALLYFARHTDLQLPMLESILPSNRLRIQSVADLILSDPSRSRVGIIGLSFKPGTDDLRESPIVQLIETLLGKGVGVQVYDDSVLLSRIMGGNKAYIEKVLPHISAMMRPSMEEVVQNSEAIVVSHEPPDGGEQLLGLLKPGQLVIDLVKIGSRKPHPAAYQGISW